MATIESKSNLTEVELGQACRAARVHKALKRLKYSGMSIGNVPDKIISYVVGFGGPAKMGTIGGWLVNYVRSENCHPAELVDLVVVLGRGVLWRLEAFPELEVPGSANQFWGFIDQEESNLLALFSHMLTWAASTSTPPNTLGYVSKVRFQNVSCL